MKISSLTTRQLAFPLSCCKLYPWKATECLCGECYPPETGVPSTKETRALPLEPESFFLNVLLAPKFQNTAQECVPKEGWGHQAGGCLVRAGQLRPATLHGVWWQIPGSVNSWLLLLKLETPFDVSACGACEEDLSVVITVLLWCQPCTEVEPREKRLGTHVRVASLATESLRVPSLAGM